MAIASFAHMATKKGSTVRKARANADAPRLAKYREKRHFDVTPEPAPGAAKTPKKGAGLAFVVQKHDARRLHYDVRIEIDGAMMSFAVPKGPSYDPSIKRLAVETEDHPMEYNDFEGRIPDGEYGAGDVLVWDRGTYETVPPGSARAMRDKGHLHVRFEGEKLRGGWHFVRSGRGGEKRQWLMFKAKDGAEDPAYDVVVARPESIVSGKKATRGPGRSTAKSARALLAGLGEVEKATLVEGPSAIADPSAYRYELKYDGYRIRAAKAGDDVVLESRKGEDWSASLKHVAHAIASLPVREIVLDGELCAVDKNGVPSFQKLQRWFGDGSDDVTITYVVFDVLFLDGRDVRALSLEERRELLEPILGGGAVWTRAAGKGAAKGAKPAVLSLSSQIDVAPGALDHVLDTVTAHGFEGLIAKRKGTPYVGARSKDWLKLKRRKRQELAIVGYAPFEGAANEVGALYLAVAMRDGSFTYAGKVGTGFDRATRKSLAKSLDALRVEAPKVAKAPRAKDARWAKPKLVGEIAFTEWTDDGKIRHPSFLGLRRDKRPEECVREDSADGPPAPSDVRPSDVVPSDVALTNPQKVLFPDDGITKRDVFDYLAWISPIMLPHLRDRPIVVQRWPNGIKAPAWYQHRAPKKVPDFVRTIEVHGEDGARTHVLVNDALTLVWLGQLAALTIHQWGSHAPTLQSPDYVVFDLDPGDTTWTDLVETAYVVKDLLDRLKLSTIVKTSGKRGLHIVAPLAPGHAWSHAFAFAESLAREIVKALPAKTTIERSKAKRGGKLYVDYGQNGPGKTIVAPYTLRALGGAPVSTPVSWDEVTASLDPRAFNLRTMRARVEKVGDLWAPALRGAGKLP